MGTHKYFNKEVESQRSLMTEASMVLNQIAGHLEYYEELKKNPVLFTEFAQKYHERRMKVLTDKYAGFLTQLFKSTADKLGFEITPKAKNCVELAEQNL